MGVRMGGCLLKHLYTAEGSVMWALDLTTSPIYILFLKLELSLVILWHVA